MTLEELQAAVEQLKSELEEKSGRVAELSKENAKWRRMAQGKEGVSQEEFDKLSAERDTLAQSLEKITKQSKSEAEKLSKALSEKDSALQRYLIDGGLSDALAKAGVAPQFMDAAKALLRQNAAIKSEGEEIKAVMGDKELSAAIAEWAASDQGKHFVAAPKNSGGGAPGSNGSGSGKAWKDMSSEERVNLYRTNPQQYEAMKSQAA